MTVVELTFFVSYPKRLYPSPIWTLQYAKGQWKMIVLPSHGVLLYVHPLCRSGDIILSILSTPSIPNRPHKKEYASMVCSKDEILTCSPFLCPTNFNRKYILSYLLIHWGFCGQIKCTCEKNCPIGWKSAVFCKERKRKSYLQRKSQFSARNYRWIHRKGDENRRELLSRD